jgi:hypothetical protein
VTVKDAAVASEAEALAGAAVPPVGEQEIDTVTEPPLFGTKSLTTVKACVLRVLVIVQETLPALAMATVAHAAWLAV